MYKKTNYINVLKEKPLQEWTVNTSHYHLNEFNNPDIKTAYQILLEKVKEEKGGKKESDKTTKPN